MQMKFKTFPESQNSQQSQHTKDTFASKGYNISKIFNIHEISRWMLEFE